MTDIFTEQINFFNNLLDNFDDASNNIKSVNKRYFKIGGKIICLLIAGHRLEEKLTPALEHLSINQDDNPDLTIYLWDSASTNTIMVNSPWNINDYNIHGKVNGFNNARFQTGVSMVSGALSMVDRENNIAVWWTSDSKNISLNESAEPFMAIFNWWFSNIGLHFMHSGAIGHADGGALLLGKKGSGKSTTSIACIDSPLMYAGDDYCLISEDQIPIVYSIYNTGKLNPKSLELLHNINLSSSYAIRYTDEKFIYFIYKLFPNKIIDRFPARAVILPIVIGKGKSSIKPISSIEALKVIGPNTLFQFSGARQRSFNAVVNLVKNIPCYQLSVGHDPIEAHKLITNVI